MTTRRAATARVVASYACASLAIGLPWPLLTVRVWEQHGAGPHGPLLVGLAAAARMLPYVLLSWAVGSLGDRWRRDRLVRITLAVRITLLAGCGLALASGGVLVAVAAAALAVAAGTPAYPALVAALPCLAGPDHRVATRTLVTVEVSAWVVGPALGGLLLLPSLRAATVPVAVALAVTALLLMHRVWLPRPLTTRVRPIAGTVRAVWTSPTVRGALATAGLLNLVVSAVALVLLPLTRDSWGHAGQDGAAFGAATACLGLGSLGAPLVWWLSRGRQPRLATGLCLLAGTVALVAVVPGPFLALPLLAAAGAWGVVVESGRTEAIQTAVPDQHRAGVLGLADSVMVGGALLGSIAGPLLAQSVGAPSALLVCAFTALVPVLSGGLARGVAAAPTMPGCPPTVIPSGRPVASGSSTGGGTPPTGW